jgi:acetyl esterase/lipase
LLEAPGVKLEKLAIGDATVYVATPDAKSSAGAPVQYLIHGGGWVLLGGQFTAALAKASAMTFGGVVFAVDYRMPPEHAYPAALDDCLAGYRELLQQYSPKDVLVVGESAGGNLAAALMLRAHDDGLPPPAALFLNTPAVDLTLQSDTLYANQGIDPIIGIEDFIGGELYANGADRAHPYLSPINGDLSRGFPATYLRTGTRDLLLSDTVRMHAKLRKAGVAADLYVGEGMPHSGFDGLSASTPEDEDARADLIRWIDSNFLK